MSAMSVVILAVVLSLAAGHGGGQGVIIIASTEC